MPLNLLMSFPTLLESLLLCKEVFMPMVDLRGRVTLGLALWLISGSESLPLMLSSSLLCLPRWCRSIRALVRMLEDLRGGSGASLVSRASAATRLLVLNTDAGIVALPLPPLTKGLTEGEVEVEVEVEALDRGL